MESQQNIEQALTSILNAKVGQTITPAFLANLQAEILDLVAPPQIVTFHVEVGEGATVDSVSAIVTNVKCPPTGATEKEVEK